MFLEIAQEFLGQFREQRRLATVFTVKIPDQLLPGIVLVKPANDRKITGQELVDVGKIKLTVNLHAPIFDISGSGLILRVADVGRKRGLQRMQVFSHVAGLLRCQQG